MNQNGDKKSSRWQNWQEVYRLVVYRSDDFKEVRSFNLSLANIYTWVSIAFLVFGAAVVSLIIFTPVKRLVPGYGEMQSNPEFKRLVEEVEVMASRMEAQDAYIMALQNLIIPVPDSIPASEQSRRDFTDINPEILSGLNFPDRPVNIESESSLSFAFSDILGKRLVNPIEGIVSSKFDPAIKHYGVDVLAPKNTPVRSIMDGFVIMSGWDLETGYTIGIQHDQNILSFYKHNSLLLKEKGTFVAAGEAVAIIGNTGTLSSGPHLHFELWHNGRAVNPEDFVNFD